MLKISIVLVELLLVSASIFMADAIQARIDLIPKAIIRLPVVDYSSDDFWTVFRYFLGIHGMLFFFVQWRLGPWIMSNAKRTAAELLSLAGGFAISTLVIFVTTSVAFDPNFIVGIALSNSILFVFIHLLTTIVKGTSPLSAGAKILSALWRRLFSVTGVLVVLLALSPAVLAKLFVSDRDVANLITQIRIYFGKNVTTDYTLVNALGNRYFHQPMLTRVSPNDPTRLYILERSGRLLSTPLQGNEEVRVELDIRTKVGKAEIENGALGFDFHPDFGKGDSKKAGYVYIYYTDVRNGKQMNKVSGFDLTTGSTDGTARTETPLIILNREPSGFHNGGAVEFGPDGFLYIAIGEGVRRHKVSTYARTFRKGILRIDVDRQGGHVSHPISRQPINGKTLNYFVPNDNPFIGRANILEEYWAIGLRNPFRMSFDPLTNALWAGDVGSTKWEEVNLIQQGGHYQFPFIEGYEETGEENLDPIQSTEYEPLYTYVHSAYDRAVIGGMVYRGNKLPALKGQYIFGDNYSSKIFAMPGDGRKVNSVTLLASADQFAQRGLSSISQLANDDILVTTLGRATEPTGEVLRLEKLSDISGMTHKDRQPGSRERPISPEEAQAIFVTNCARCHGSTGKGDGPDSLEMEVGILNFASHDFQNSRTDEQLRLVIMKGGEEVELSKMMPPWEGILEPNEVDALIKLLRGFKAPKPQDTP